MDRTQRLLRSLPRDARVVEVGPSFRPLAPKRDGWDAFVIDHAPREELRAKYADQDADRIEEVDYVWRGGSLADAVPRARHGTFDAFIASHVIEHTTDVVAFLKAAETLIKPDGVVILAVPDKRKCFDFYRPPSTTGDALAAFHEARTRHDIRTQFEYAMRTVLKGGGPGWHADDTRATEFIHPFEDARGSVEVAARPDYVDAHNWVFVPASFRLMLLELAAMGHVDLRAEEVAEAPANEFFAWLRRGREAIGPAELQGRRKDLMDAVIYESAQQLGQLPEDRQRALRAGDVSPDVIAAERYRFEAMRTVLAAVLASTGWGGLNRRKFKRMLAEASRAIPGEGPAAVQHLVLMTEARKVLGG